jgi:hypothetical protein
MSSAILFAVSLIAGFALERFSWRALAMSSAALGVLAAAVLQRQGLEPLPGIVIVVACLVIHQAAYLLARVWFVGHKSVQKHARHYPGQGPNKDIGRKDQENKRPPSATVR